MKQENNYFDIVNLIDRVFPSKSVLDYTKISPLELVKRFDNELNEMGYQLDEKLLMKLNRFIGHRQSYNYHRLSNSSDNNGLTQGFDQYNYFVQNNLSQIKTVIIGVLYKTNCLLVPGQPIVDSKLRDIKERLSSFDIKAYINDVLSISCEPNDTIKPDAVLLAEDIMLHLGLSIQNIYQNNKIKTQIANAIRKLEVTSRIIHKQKYPVNGDISTTNMHVYNSSKGLAVDTIYEVLCQTIKDILDKTATYRKTDDSSNVGLTNTVDKYHLLQQLYATRMSLIGELDNAKKTVANLEAQLAANAEEIKRHR